MKKALLLFVAVLGLSINATAQTTWKVDPMHSFLNFSVKHLGISFVDGRMDKYDGTLVLTKEDITTGKFNFTVDVNSIDTDVEARDNHLKSTDFFEASKYGTMTFVSTSIKKEGKNYKMTGNLTIKGVTKPVTFDLVYGGKAANDGYGNEKLGFQAKTTIDRTAFNINYDPTGMGIAKDVELVINLEFGK